MDKTAKSGLHRVFLTESLPEPLTRASAHLQIFDNYVADTRLRLRSIRNPETKEWTRILQQKFSLREEDITVWKTAEIYLSEFEYSRFNIFEGREIRKNRYFHEFDGRLFAFDVYLGKLWGLNMARVDFESLETMRRFSPPPFIFFEVTTDPFFLGENLVEKTFAAVQAEVAKIGEAAAVVSEMPDD